MHIAVTDEFSESPQSRSAFGSGDTGCGKGFQGVVPGKQQVAPAFAYGAVWQFAEFDDDVPRAIISLGVSGEFWLLTCADEPCALPLAANTA